MDLGGELAGGRHDEAGRERLAVPAAAVVLGLGERARRQQLPHRANHR